MLWLAVASTLAASPSSSLAVSGQTILDPDLHLRVAAFASPTPPLALTVRGQYAREVPSFASALTFTVAGGFLAVAGIGTGATGGVLVANAHGSDSQISTGWIIAGAGAVLFLAGVPLFVIGLKQFSERTETVSASLGLDPTGRAAVIRVALRN